MITLDTVFAELRKLNIEVPKSQRLPTEEEVAQAEEQLGVSFHPDYRRFLLESSDVVVPAKEPAIVTATPGSSHDLVETVRVAWKVMGVPTELLPFCEDNGAYYCLNSDGEIAFWTHGVVAYERWPNLATWIKEVWIERG